ncbi:hypothetical protein NM208_g5275 [Fusarium decemcellulare]|uniref:Uncharacterized protein n=1 Tax=Fusarium decemcellulare TaxID=57161 RepID=A0ACC1SHM3_9HYPO|nr:hypothetical protein NM208_g5275 [Fusarium decemcellulare]
MALLKDRDLAQEGNYGDAQEATPSNPQHDALVVGTTSVAPPNNILPFPLAPGMLSQVSGLASQNSYLHLVDLGVASAAQLPIGPDLPVSVTNMSVYPNRDWAPTGPVSQGSVLQARAEYAAHRLANQSLAFVQFGQTAFIHHTQIEASEFLQDALAASALNAMRNATNAAIVRSEINRRVDRLCYSLCIKLNAISTNALGDREDLLPVLQSMLIYQCIRLFSDNEISQRMRAERDEEVLRALVSNLVFSVKSFSEDGRWVSWIKEESLRRTMLVAELLIGVYSFLRQGWDQAEVRLSRLGFTAQASLWEAKSLGQWEEMWRCGPRYQVHLVSLEKDMAAARPENLEELGMLICGTYLGLEKLEEWLGWEHHALVYWGLRGHS